MTWPAWDYDPGPLLEMEADPADRHPLDMPDWEWETSHPSDQLAMDADSKSDRASTSRSLAWRNRTARRNGVRP